VQTRGRASPALTRCGEGMQGTRAGGFPAFGSRLEIVFGKSPQQSPATAAPERAAGGGPAPTHPLQRPAALGTAQRQSQEAGARQGGELAGYKTQSRADGVHTHARRPRATAGRRLLRFPQRHGRSDTFTVPGMKRPKRCSLCSFLCYFCCARKKHQRGLSFPLQSTSMAGRGDAQDELSRKKRGVGNV